MKQPETKSHSFITSKYEQQGMRWTLLTFPAAGAWVDGGEK